MPVRMGIFSNVGYVCTVMQLYGWGGPIVDGNNKAAGYSNYTKGGDGIPNFLKEIEAAVTGYNQHSGGYCLFQRLGLVQAYVTSKQEHAIKTLREFGGWTECVSQDMIKYEHDIHSFVMPVKEFILRFNALAKEHKLAKLPLPKGWGGESIDAPAGDDDD